MQGGWGGKWGGTIDNEGRDLQSATTRVDEARSLWNCSPDDMRTVFDILKRGRAGSVVSCAWLSYLLLRSCLVSTSKSSVGTGHQDTCWTFVSDVWLTNDVRPNRRTFHKSCF